MIMTNEFAKYKLIKRTFYASCLLHVKFTWTRWKKYELLIIGLILASSNNSCYHFNDRGCSDVEGLTNSKLNTLEKGSGNT